MTADQVVKHYGGLVPAAMNLGVSVTTLHNWYNKGIPPLRQRDIEHVSKGRLKVGPKRSCRK